MGKAFIIDSNIRDCILNSRTQLKLLNDYYAKRAGAQPGETDDIGISDRGETTDEYLNGTYALKVDMSCFEEDQALEQLKKFIRLHMRNLKFLYLYVPKKKAEQCKNKFDLSLLEFAKEIEVLALENMTIRKETTFESLKDLKKVELFGTKFESFATLSTFPNGVSLHLDDIGTYDTNERLKKIVEIKRRDDLSEFFFKHSGPITVSNSTKISAIQEWVKALKMTHPIMSLTSAILLARNEEDLFTCAEFIKTADFIVDERFIKTMQSESSPEERKKYVDDINEFIPADSEARLVGNFEDISYLIIQGIKCNVCALKTRQGQGVPRHTLQVPTKGNIIKKYVRQKRKKGFNRSEMIDLNNSYRWSKYNNGNGYYWSEWPGLAVAAAKRVEDAYKRNYRNNW